MNEALSVEGPQPNPKPFLGTRTQARTSTDIVIAMGVCLFLAAIFFRMVAQSRFVSTRPWTCMSNIKQNTLTCIMYANDFDDVLPKGSIWMDSVFHYSKNEHVFHDVPGGLDGDKYGYAFRNAASKMNTNRIAKQSEFVLMFDSSLLYRNATSDLSTLPHPGRHSGLDNLGFLDGHAKAIKVTSGPKINVRVTFQ